MSNKRRYIVELQPMPEASVWRVNANSAKEAVGMAISKIPGVDCRVVSVNGRGFVSWCLACHGVILEGDPYFCDESGDRICGICKQQSEELLCEDVINDL